MQLRHTEGAEDMKGFQKLEAICIDTTLVLTNYGWKSDFSIEDLIRLLDKLWLDE